MLASVLAFASCTTAPPLDEAAPSTVSAKPATGHDGALAQADAAGTEHDDAGWRFDMQEDGEPLAADDFDAWMERKDVNVATGTAATQATDDCPSVEGDGEHTEEHSDCRGE